MAAKFNAHKTPCIGILGNNKMVLITMTLNDYDIVSTQFLWEYINTGTDNINIVRSLFLVTVLPPNPVNVA